MIRVLVMSQMESPSEETLKREPILFENLIIHAESRPWGTHRPEVLLVAEDYVPPMATTVFRANEKTRLAEVWKKRWDSSG